MPARFANNCDDLPLTVEDALPAVQQRAQFIFAPDERPSSRASAIAGKRPRIPLGRTTR
jgi:hypothetical protein